MSTVTSRDVTFDDAETARAVTESAISRDGTPAEIETAAQRETDLSDRYYAGNSAAELAAAHVRYAEEMAVLAEADYEAEAAEYDVEPEAGL